MQAQLEQLQVEVLEAIQSCATEADLITYKNDILGKKGRLTDILKGVKDLSAEQKATVGKMSNDMKKAFALAFSDRIHTIQKEVMQKQLQEEFEDMTIPSDATTSYARHPIKMDQDRVIDVFSRMGFDIHRSPDITTGFDNFDALNLPQWHPARDMQDTFWLEDGRVLATQTSCMQNTLLKESQLPIRSIVLGSVYRNEKIDSTHDVMFDQVEGLVVGKDIHMGHLKHTIETMLEGILGYTPKIRMRPGYFPFVEPGVEVDIWWEESGKWLELMGA